MPLKVMLLAGAALLTSAALPACSGACQTTEQQGPGLSGTMSYTTGDGTRVGATLEKASIHADSDHDVTLEGDFTDGFGRDRYYELDLHDLSPGTDPMDLAGHGQVCFQRQSGDPSTCSDLTGSIEVRKLSIDCYHHESGVSLCAETMDLTLHAASEWQKTMFRLDAVEQTTGSWRSTACAD